MKPQQRDVAIHGSAAGEVSTGHCFVSCLVLYTFFNSVTQLFVTNLPETEPDAVVIILTCYRRTNNSHIEAMKYVISKDLCIYLEP